jgi:hypothetical protein
MPVRQPALTEWKTVEAMRFWAERCAELGDLVAIKLGPTPRWAELDNVIRAACDTTMTESATDARVPMHQLSTGWMFIQVAKLAEVVTHLRTVGGLQFLQLREVPR